MRAAFAIARVYVPRYLRRRKIAELVDATAKAFCVPAPALEGLSYDEQLSAFARFTRQSSDEALIRGDVNDIENRLRENAYAIGLALRNEFGVKSLSDAMKVAGVVYQVIGIDFRGDAEGKILIRKCFFSPFYTAETCRLISSLDEGLLAGLSGCDHLHFEKRITEGGSFCEACLSFKAVQR